MVAWIALVLLLISGGLVVLRHEPIVVSGHGTLELAAGFAVAALLLFMAFPPARAQPQKWERRMRSIGLWGSATLVLVVLYSARDDLVGMMRAISPQPPRTAAVAAAVWPNGVASPNDAAGRRAGRGSPVSPGASTQANAAVRIARAAGGQFIALTHVNGVALDMLVDTGATIVMLRAEDARQIGIPPSTLTFDTETTTANGKGLAARIRLERVAVGPVILHDVDALVAQPGRLQRSLLGMSFLSRLQSYDFAGRFLTLKL